VLLIPADYYFPYKSFWQSFPKTVEVNFFKKVMEQTVLKFSIFVQKMWKLFHREQ